MGNDVIAEILPGLPGIIIYRIVMWVIAVFFTTVLMSELLC